jgi:TrmH family RNA methyltransferase
MHKLMQGPLLLFSMDVYQLDGERDMTFKITSSQNPLIKEIKSFRSRKNRSKKGLFIIEGSKLFFEALNEEEKIASIFMSEQFLSTGESKEILARAAARSIKTYALPDRLFKAISDTESPQGILAIIKARHRNINQLPAEGNLLVILETLQDPGNMGTIIRTADAAGFTGIIVSQGCVDVYNPKVLRSTMGSIFHIPLFFSDNLGETIQILKSKGTKIYAAHLKGTSNYFQLDMHNDTAIIIGNESKGISAEIAALADELVKIPMIGKAESLNASVAAALLMYESVRQRINQVL